MRFLRFESIMRDTSVDAEEGQEPPLGRIIDREESSRVRLG
jgi:hypothetical protein